MPRHPLAWHALTRIRRRSPRLEGGFGWKIQVNDEDEVRARLDVRSAAVFSKRKAPWNEDATLSSGPHAGQGFLETADRLGTADDDFARHPAIPSVVERGAAGQRGGVVHSHGLAPLDGSAAALLQVFDAQVGAVLGTGRAALALQPWIVAARGACAGLPRERRPRARRDEPREDNAKYGLVLKHFS